VRTRETKFCLRVLEYLEKHYKENLTSAEVARDLFYNQSYFCRLFKKNFGLCFSEYLILFRLNKAKYMLEDKTLSITDIAYETGFSTASYFIKVFHRENGVTPKRFREINF
jgi:YesN/AraC family two-component response regulator